MNYQETTYSLIDYLIKDWHEADGNEKRLPLAKMASVYWFNGLTVDEIIEVAEKRNELFYFLDNEINIAKLKSEIENEINKFKEDRVK